MKIKTITISKTFNTGNYTSKRIELTGEVSAKENLIEARVQLEEAINIFGKMDIARYRHAEEIVNDSFNYSERERIEAAEYMAQFKEVI